jgi:hypothetical protein
MGERLVVDWEEMWPTTSSRRLLKIDEKKAEKVMRVLMDLFEVYEEPTFEEDVARLVHGLNVKRRVKPKPKSSAKA